MFPEIKGPYENLPYLLLLLLHVESIKSPLKANSCYTRTREKPSYAVCTKCQASTIDGEIEKE